MLRRAIGRRLQMQYLILGATMATYYAPPAVKAFSLLRTKTTSRILFRSMACSQTSARPRHHISQRRKATPGTPPSIAEQTQTSGAIRTRMAPSLSSKTKPISTAIKSTKTVKETCPMLHRLDSISSLLSRPNYSSHEYTFV